MSLIQDINKEIQNRKDIDPIERINILNKLYKQRKPNNHVYCGYELYLKFKELEDDKDEFR